MEKVFNLLNEHLFGLLRNEEYLRKFANLVDQKSLGAKTKSMWYPMLGPSAASLSRWIDEE